MTDFNTIEGFLWNAANVWHQYGMDASSYTGSMLYILCLKKMVESNDCTNPEYMGDIVELTKILYRPTSIEDLVKINESTRIVEQTYGIDQGLLYDIVSPTRYQEEAWKKAFLEIIRMTSEVQLDQEGLYNVATQLIYNLGKGGARFLGRVSSNAVADLLSIAADVQPGESVLDGSVGYGFSAMKCIHNVEDVQFTGIDIAIDAVQVATMYMILAGCEKVSIKAEDFTNSVASIKADKVVMDIPFGMRTNTELTGYQLERTKRWMDSDSCKEMECLFMASALDSLNENGRFTVIVPQGILFKQSKGVSSFRQNLIKEGMLKAVVSLPPIYNGTMINTALLIFERNNKDVLFVDGSIFVQRERRNDAVISQENQARLHEILNEGKEIENVSFKISNEKVLEIGDWSISRYIDSEESIEFRSINEINKDLEIQYKRLEELAENTRKNKLFN